MKIILSRKGFDSGVGKVASPILPSGDLCWVPIPETDSGRDVLRYGDIKVEDQSSGLIVNDLTSGRITDNCRVHLDPDLNFDSIPRKPGWKPLFGQAGAAEGHLQRQDVKSGDIFLFFGWFCRVEHLDEKYIYTKNVPNLHVIFGWLQVEQRISVNNLSGLPDWVLDHPDCQRTDGPKTNSIYIATDHLALPNVVIDKPGGGIFEKFDPDLCLTATGRSRSIWRLPIWFHPDCRGSSLTYHNKLDRWTKEQNYVLLNSAKRGQEFVLDCDQYPESVEWLANILERFGRNNRASSGGGLST